MEFHIITPRWAELVMRTVDGRLEIVPPPQPAPAPGAVAAPVEPAK